MKHPILWIHGWGMSKQVWGDVATLLPGLEHHFFTYAGCDTIESFHTALNDKLVSEGDKTSWTLIGWSLGGMLALEKWMNGFKHPAAYSIESIIIVGGSLRFANVNRHLGWPVRVIESMQKQLQINPQAIMQQFALSMFSNSDRAMKTYDAAAETVIACALATDFSLVGLDAGLTYLRNMDLVAKWLETMNAAAASNSPKLLWLHGAEDPICMMAGMPQLDPTDFFIFAETGHVPFLTEPEVFYDKVRSFLNADHTHRAQ
jgi:pimeloyl-[acyl-carrier protein] methyl ester esterase